MDESFDPVAASPYVRRFSREIERLTPRPVGATVFERAAARADVVFLAEYHPLPGALDTARELLDALAARGRAVALAIEMIHARDQRVLDRYLAGTLPATALRRRIRHREEWGYPWRPAAALLARARALGVPVAALDLPPRGGVEGLALRDAAAAERIAALRARLPRRATVIAVFGEAHLAASHLPRRTARRLAPGARLVRVFHDLEQPLARGVYAASAGDFVVQRAAPGARAAALARTWRVWEADFPAPGEIDLGLVVHGMYETLAGLAGVDPRRERIGPALWLADACPAVLGPEPPRALARQLAADGADGAAIDTALAEIARCGVAYVPGAHAVAFARPALHAALWPAAQALVAAWRGAADPVFAAGLARRLDPFAPLPPGVETAVLHGPPRALRRVLRREA